MFTSGLFRIGLFQETLYKKFFYWSHRMKIESREQREKLFLETCGFDLSHGFWSEDVEAYKRLHPELWQKIVAEGAEPPPRPSPMGIAEYVDKIIHRQNEAAARADRIAQDILVALNGNATMNQTDLAIRIRRLATEIRLITNPNPNSEFR